MILELAPLPDSIRGPADPDYKGRVPTRARFLHPSAAESFVALEAASGGLIYTDIFRSADASLAACKSKRGCQRPAYSAHNFGLAFDLDLDATEKSLKASYKELTDLLKRYGWFCHRRDGAATGMESWHFNFLGETAGDYLIEATAEHSTWSIPVEKRIAELYGDSFHLANADMQLALTKLKMYSGELDAKIGPLTIAALRAFQRAWGITEDRIEVGGVTQRTLAYCAATVEVVNMPLAPDA